MTKWKKEKPLEKVARNPCLHCPDPLPTLSMEHHIGVGFGSAYLSCDGKIIFDENECVRDGGDFEDLMTVEQAEKKANLSPNHDWRIVLHGPLHGETYQRQGKGKWVCIEQNEGFA